MYKVFNDLLVQKGVKPSDVARATGISPSILSDWKTGRSIPKIDKLQRLANYFDVDVKIFLDKVTV